MTSSSGIRSLLNWKLAYSSEDDLIPEEDKVRSTSVLRQTQNALRSVS